MGHFGRGNLWSILVELLLCLPQLFAGLEIDHFEFALHFRVRKPLLIFEQWNQQML
jgi:hypothetical protein